MFTLGKSLPSCLKASAGLTQVIFTAKSVYAGKFSDTLSVASEMSPTYVKKQSCLS